MRFVAEVASDSTVGARNAGESIRLFMVPGTNVAASFSCVDNK